MKHYYTIERDRIDKSIWFLKCNTLNVSGYIRHIGSARWVFFMGGRGDIKEFRDEERLLNDHMPDALAGFLSRWEHFL